MAKSQTNTARIDGLRPGMVYVVQVRARTVAGYGKYSGKMCFQTLTDGEWERKEMEEWGMEADWGKEGGCTFPSNLQAVIGLNQLVSPNPHLPVGQRGESQVIYRDVWLIASWRTNLVEISYLCFLPEHLSDYFKNVLLSAYE